MKTSRALWKIKKEPYNNSSGTLERAELAAALKQIDYSTIGIEKANGGIENEKI